jgi:hypothetical protein
MKKHNVEPLKESLTLISENSLERLSQKAWNLTIVADFTLWGTDKRFSAYRWLLRHSNYLWCMNLVNPICSQKGRNSVRGNNGMLGRGKNKKQKSICNELNKGLKIYLDPKGC